MMRARTWIRMFVPLIASALVVAGCGGADAPPPDTGDAAAPPATGTPDPAAPGGTVAAPGGLNPDGTPVMTDPATGLPITPSTGATASVPDLSGGDVGGGLAAANGTGLFTPNAVTPDNGSTPAASADPFATLPGSTSPTTSTFPTTTTVAAKYTGAVIYMDGITYKVTRGASFPKGNPVFRLLSISSSDIEIELIAGEFTTSGGDGTFIDKGDLLTFSNASEGVNYKVKYVRPISDSTGVTF